MHTQDVADANIEKIGQMFPNCLTERINESGKPEMAIDFDKLKQELSKEIVEGNQERYQFTWPGKREAMRLANTPSNMTLRPDRESSVDFDNTENLYIEGDNLEVLKLLRENYLGMIRMIYIDPPYNTGHEFVYNDKYEVGSDEWKLISGEYDQSGLMLSANTTANGRFHSDWLNMMYTRLKVAKDLLSSDGVIFISIDDNEVKNMLNLCDQVFGESCFVANVIWQKNYSAKNNSQGIPATTEYVIVYSKQPGWTPKRLARTEEMDSKYKNPDNDYAAWTSSDPCAPGASTHQGMVYAIQHPFTGEYIYPATSCCWRYQQDALLEIMNGWCEYELMDLHDEEQRAAICGISASDVRSGVKGIVLKNSLEQSKTAAESVLNRGQWPKFYFTKNGLGGIRRKTYLDNLEGRLVTTMWNYNEVGHTDEAKKEIKKLFEGEIPFDTPKPTRLLDRMIEISADRDSIILDFFSGSATTAHSVMKKNFEDNGNRKYILVQLAEGTGNPTYPTICDIAKERIRRAAKSLSSAQTQPEEAGLFDSSIENTSIDTGFRVLKLDTSNMRDVYYKPEEFSETSLFEDNVKLDRTPEDLLFQVMLECNLPLSAKIERKTIAGKEVFNVNDGYLLACFAEDVNESVITEVAKLKPYYFIMRDKSLGSDNVADNFEQIFNAYSKDTIRKIL